MAISKIEWRLICWNNNYEVSNIGGVRNRTNGFVLSPYKNDKSGHLSVKLYVNGNHRGMAVHRLVLTAFIGECPTGMQCRHLDGDATNNCLENLSWGTASENVRDAIRHGTHVDNRGEACGSAKLTKHQVIEIRRLASSIEQQNIAQMFNVSESSISQIVNRWRWTHI